MANQSNPGQADTTTINPTSTASASQNSKKELLTFILPAATKGETDRHALVLLPKTYDEAVTSAIHVLDLADIPSNIILRCHVRTDQYLWVWADIHPEDWQLLVSSGDNIGVFEKISVVKGTEHFLQGEVYLSFGRNELYRLFWPGVTDAANQDAPKSSVLVRRPSTLTDAVKIIRSASVSNSGGWNYAFGAYNLVQGWTNEDWKKATPKIKFYRFTSPNLSIKVYQELPSLAYMNDDAWRTLVPSPGAVLGVVLPSRSEF